MSITLLKDLKKLRKARKLSRERLGAIIGAHRNTVMRIEAGEIPKLELALRIANVFGLAPQAIWWVQPPQKEIAGDSNGHS